MFDEGLSDLGTFLVNAVAHGVGDSLDALQLPLSSTDRIHSAVYAEQLIMIVGQIFESDAFRVLKKQYEYSLRQSWHNDFQILVFRKNNSIVLGNDQ